MSCIFQRWPMIISKRNNRSGQVSLPQWQPLHFQRQLHCYSHRQGWLQVLMLNLDLMFGEVGNKSKGLSNLVDMQNNHNASKRQMLIWSMIMCWNEQVTERVPATEEFFRRRLLLQTSIGHDYHLWIVLGRYHDNYHLQTMIGDYPDIKPAQITLDYCKANHRSDVLLCQICSFF